jgi:histidinol-phosphate/aromatic aminotransferase/cobyric acid decarboxylase-like protein/GNAT superfamily N-acetyltransferase
LRQHPSNHGHSLRDSLDDFNTYLVAKIAGEIAAFVSITPPGAPSYSIDKYLGRAALPFPVDEGFFEVRLLTVLKAHRGRELAVLLMYAALRWVEAHNGTHVAAIGRVEILEFYLKAGLQPMGLRINSGAVSYELLHATVAELRDGISGFSGLLARLEEKTSWRLSFPFFKPASCFHGGAFFEAIGEEFDRLERSRDIINADVLDAWYPPAPGVLATLADHLPWLLRTSPPTSGAGLIKAIARARGVQPSNILPGAGSSDLIFRSLRHWLDAKSHVCILDPTYGEYSHVLENVIGCTVDRLGLDRENGFIVDLDRLRAVLQDEYDLVVLVNPNSPTGRHIPRNKLESLLGELPGRTRVWIDETYVEYAGPGESMERFAARSENVVVCKSMSKVYALSGARVAYLCAGPHQLEALRAITPPWVVGLPAQVAAVRALQDPDYYAGCYHETARLRTELSEELRKLGWAIYPGIANFLLCELPGNGPDAAEVVRRCRARGLFLRNASAMGAHLGERILRVAVKEAGIQRRLLRILEEELAASIG